LNSRNYNIQSDNSVMQQTAHYIPKNTHRLQDGKMKISKADKLGHFFDNFSKSIYRRDSTN